MNSDSNCPLSIQSRTKNGTNEVTVAGIKHEIELNSVNIRIGDRLLEINSEPVTSSQQAYMALKHASSGVRITLLRKAGDELKKTPSMVVESENEEGMLVIRSYESEHNKVRSVGLNPVDELQWCGKVIVCKP